MFRQLDSVTSGHFRPGVAIIPCLKAERMDMNKPSGDWMGLEKLSQTTFQPRSCSENVMNVSQTPRNKGQLVEKEAIHPNGCDPIFLSG